MSGDDRELIEKCLRGHKAAYGELVVRYQDRLYNTVYRLLNNAEDARDVVQEAFLNAYLSLDRYKGDALFSTWLYRIAVNAAISWKRKTRLAVRFEAVGQDGLPLDPEDPSEAAQPDFHLERSERDEMVREALGRLSPEHRTALVLKDIDGLKYDEMAVILDVPIGTVRSRLHRARLELRELLREGNE